MDIIFRPREYRIHLKTLFCFLILFLFCLVFLKFFQSLNIFILIIPLLGYICIHAIFSRKSYIRIYDNSIEFKYLIYFTKNLRIGDINAIGEEVNFSFDYLGRYGDYPAGLAFITKSRIYRVCNLYSNDLIYELKRWARKNEIILFGFANEPIREINELPPFEKH